MTYADLIWNFITTYGLLPTIISLLLVIVCIVPIKGKSLIKLFRTWFNQPMSQEFAEAAHFDIRRSLITEAYFIKSSVNDGTWDDALFMSYKSLLSRYYELSDKYKLKDGEVLESVDLVNDLYASKHDGHKLFSEKYIEELEKVLHG